jgi:hypothetical protein
MADSDDADLDMTDAEKPVDNANPVRERSRLTFTAVWMVLAVLAVVIVATYLIISHKGHTKALTPGQPQKPVAAIVGG